MTSYDMYGKVVPHFWMTVTHTVTEKIVPSFTAPESQSFDRLMVIAIKLESSAVTLDHIY